MMRFEAGTETVGGQGPRGVSRQSQSFGDGLAKERIAECAKHQEQGRLADVMLFMADAQLGNQRAKRLQDRIERVAIARKDHPRRKRSGAFTPESIESHVDDFAGIRFTCPGAFDSWSDPASDLLGDRARQLRLKSGRRAKVMEQIGVGPSDLGRDGFERHCLRAMGQEQAPRGFERDGPAFLRGKALAGY
jgi:hypothetical protein